MPSVGAPRVPPPSPSPPASPLLQQLAFLVLSLTQSCLQLHRAAQEGVHSYWGEPGSWLEVAVLSPSPGEAGQ